MANFIQFKNVKIAFNRPFKIVNGVLKIIKLFSIESTEGNNT